jgi:hypothetical protein
MNKRILGTALLILTFGAKPVIAKTALAKEIDALEHLILARVTAEDRIAVLDFTNLDGQVN